MNRYPDVALAQIRCEQRNFCLRLSRRGRLELDNHFSPAARFQSRRIFEDIDATVSIAGRLGPQQLNGVRTGIDEFQNDRFLNTGGNRAEVATRRNAAQGGTFTDQQPGADVDSHNCREADQKES